MMVLSKKTDELCTIIYASYDADERRVTATLEPLNGG
jgi:hypothetical protein